MKMRDAILAETVPLPPIPSDLAYQFVIAGNGTFIRAEDSRIEAMVPVALAHVHGLEEVEPYARLKPSVPCVPNRFLWAIYKSAQRHLPNEAMYQLIWEPIVGWRCTMPMQETDIAFAKFTDDGRTVIDLHSHARMSAFFSDTDNRDEQGLRFYVVIGNVDVTPALTARVGVYGHHFAMPATTIFEGLDPFSEVKFYGSDDPFDEIPEGMNEA